MAEQKKLKYINARSSRLQSVMSIFFLKRYEYEQYYFSLKNVKAREASEHTYEENNYYQLSLIYK